MINYWRFRMMDGETVTLASDLVRDRAWMEENSTGTTPWMRRAADDALTLPPDAPMVRVDLDFVQVTEWHQAEGYLP